MHASLTPKANVRLIALWATIALLVAVFLAQAQLWLLFVIGSLLGIVAGLMQLRAINESSEELVAADSAMAVRRALKRSGWGKAYLVCFWLSSIGIVVVAIVVLKSEMFSGWLAGYSSYAFARELVALPGTFALARFVTERAGLVER